MKPFLASNIPLKDPSNVPDPYVKLYLLPGRAKDTKRKTIIVKDSCNPVYDATFEYLISTADLNNGEVEVTVATQKGFLSAGGPVIGMVSSSKCLITQKPNNNQSICFTFQVKISLNDPEIAQAGTNKFYDLLPEFKSE